MNTNKNNNLKTMVWKFSKIALAIFSVAMFLVSCNPMSVEQPKPNVIYILADDMGYNVPGVYGGELIKTPHIDQLANNGLLFTEAYAGNSVCAPSRASLLTGLHTGHTSLRGNTGGISIKDSDITIAEVLKQAGYKTGGFGKWGLGDVGTEGIPEKQGFDRFFGYYHQIHAHFYYTDYLWENSNKIPVLNKEGDAGSYTHYRIMKEMKDFIKENKSGPFFCFGSWTIPHTDDIGLAQIPETDPAYLLYKDEAWSEQSKKYAAMNTLFDSGVGEILSLLQELGIEENTLVIFASDNGGGNTFDEVFDVSGKLRGFKHQFYEGGIKVPFVAYWKGKIQPGTKSEIQTCFADIMPTLAELAGADQYLPSNIDGISLVPTLLQKGEQILHDYMYWELPAFDWENSCYEKHGLQQAIRKDNWKLLRHDQLQPWELYNLEKDPMEQNNLASANQELVEELIRKIQENRTEMPVQIEPKMEDGKWYR